MKALINLASLLFASCCFGCSTGGSDLGGLPLQVVSSLKESGGFVSKDQFEIRAPVAVGVNDGLLLESCSSRRDVSFTDLSSDRAFVRARFFGAIHPTTDNGNAPPLNGSEGVGPPPQGRILANSARLSVNWAGHLVVELVDVLDRANHSADVTTTLTFEYAVR
jgi:hypothetical protein